MLWILLALLLLLWIAKFGLAITGWWLTLLLSAFWLLFVASLFVRHEQR